MGLSAADRMKAGGIAAKKGSTVIVPIDDVWVPPLGHPLGHPRGQDAVDEALCNDIVAKCKIEKAIVVRDDGIVDGKRRLTLLDGARRTVNGREAQSRLRNAGTIGKEQHFYVEVEFFSGNDSEFWLERLRLNADPLKKPDRPSVLAESFIQLRRLHTSVEAILDVAPRGIGRREVEALFDFGNLAYEAAQRFDEGAPVVFLRSVLDAPRDKQLEVIDTLIAKGVKTAAGATRTLRREQTAQPRLINELKLRPKKEIFAMREAFKQPLIAAEFPVLVSMLDYITGDDKAFDKYPDLKKSIDEFVG